MENELALQNKYIQLYQASREAIEHIDSGLAERILREIKTSPIFSSLGKSSNLELTQKIYDLKTKMQIVNFLAISDDEAEDIIKNHLLDFFRIDISLKERLEARYNYQGHSEINRIRLILKKALLENTEPLGHIAINKWIEKFELYKQGTKKTENAIMRFILEDIKARELSEIEKGILKSILFTYKKFLASKLVDVFDAVATIQDESGVLENNDTSTDYPEVESNFESVTQKKETLISLTLNDAIKKYPEVGEQLITSQKIELKNFHEPVRPSIKNWLADYVYLLGYENHDAIERGNYLFHTTNTRRLPDSDRERLAYILKAFDEKFPVDVDKDRQMIIFPSVQKSFTPKPASSSFASTPVVSNKTSFPVRSQAPIEKNELINFQSRPSIQASPQAKPQPAIPSAYESYSIKKTDPSEQLSAGKIFSESDNNSNIQETKFDFPQRMPFEKEKEHVAHNTYHVAENTEKATLDNSNLQPYRISSSATRDTTVKSQSPIHPNNVIDLKSRNP